jgi:hypothetical protein
MRRNIVIRTANEGATARIIYCISFSDAVSTKQDAMVVVADAGIIVCTVTIFFLGATVADYPQPCNR